MQAALFGNAPAQCDGLRAQNPAVASPSFPTYEYDIMDITYKFMAL